MARYKIGFHKNNLLGSADTLDEARKVAVRLYTALSDLDKGIAPRKMQIYSGNTPYAEVLFGPVVGVNAKGYSETTMYAYHRNYSARTAQPFNPKTGKLR
jgi:hypothetical protein